MQYLLIAYDGTDSEAETRRLQVREEHLKVAKKMKEEGSLILGGAILDDNGKMIGSSCICEFEKKEDLDHWLKTDPYVTANVWQTIEVKPFKVPDVLN